MTMFTVKTVKMQMLSVIIVSRVQSLDAAPPSFSSAQNAILCFRENSVEIQTKDRDPGDEHELKV